MTRRQFFKLGLLGLPLWALMPPAALGAGFQPDVIMDIVSFDTDGFTLSLDDAPEGTQVYYSS